MSQNSHNTAPRGTTPEETNQSPSQGATPETNNGTGSANIGQPRHHARRNNRRNLIVIEAFDMDPEEEPVMVSHEEASLDEDESEWIKDLFKEDGEEADNAQGSRV
ncbi:hypothetical protein N0V84_008185 [Fusarium piperis]|uniref:Uncharacterized protein n=1 Tax=Fusarium piperis TaxID=1435070 RepID=A0A9W8W8L5_9HYPO|nr:hypothetical protein N0V84_008185 [Fusarium piperis]